jgi:hypothetical protein
MEQHVKHFWQNMSPAHREIVANEEVVDWIWKFDAVLYDVCDSSPVFLAWTWTEASSRIARPS